MKKNYQTIAYVLTFLVVVGLLAVWKLFTAKNSPEYLARRQAFIEATKANVLAPGGDNDASLKIYAVIVTHTLPSKDPSIGYGIYLGDGLVLTAAHVVGRYPLYTNPHVIIAGQDLRAKVIKEGSPETTDLAILSVDQEHLPMSLRLRRNPQCKQPLQVGTNVIVVYPEQTVRSQIISPLLIPAQYRSRFTTLINEPQGSGSGVFDAQRKCLIGIMSARVTKYAYQNENGRMTIRDNGFAGYFVPVSKGASFIPPQYRF